MIGDRQSQIENQQTHPLPRGGTDLMIPRVECMHCSNCIRTGVRFSYATIIVPVPLSVKTSLSSALRVVPLRM